MSPYFSVCTVNISLKSDSLNSFFNGNDLIIKSSALLLVSETYFLLRIALNAVSNSFNPLKAQFEYCLKSLETFPVSTYFFNIVVSGSMNASATLNCCDDFGV